MAKLDLKQRRELSKILEILENEDALSEVISDLIEERDNCKRAYGKLFMENAALEGRIDGLMEQLNEG